MLFKSLIYEWLSLKELVEIPDMKELMDLPFLLLKWQIDIYAEEVKRFHYEIPLPHSKISPNLFQNFRFY